MRNQRKIRLTTILSLSGIGAAFLRFGWEKADDSVTRRFLKRGGPTVKVEVIDEPIPEIGDISKLPVLKKMLTPNYENLLNSTKHKMKLKEIAEDIHKESIKDIPLGLYDMLSEWTKLWGGMIDNESPNGMLDVLNKQDGIFAVSLNLELEDDTAALLRLLVSPLVHRLIGAEIWVIYRALENYFSVASFSRLYKIPFPCKVDLDMWRNRNEVRWAMALLNRLEEVEPVRTGSNRKDYDFGTEKDKCKMVISDYDKSTNFRFIRDKLSVCSRNLCTLIRARKLNLKKDLHECLPFRWLLTQLILPVKTWNTRFGVKIASELEPLKHFSVVLGKGEEFWSDIESDLTGGSRSTGPIECAITGGNYDERLFRSDVFNSEYMRLFDVMKDWSVDSDVKEWAININKLYIREEEVDEGGATTRLPMMQPSASKFRFGLEEKKSSKRNTRSKDKTKTHETFSIPQLIGLCSPAIKVGNFWKYYEAVFPSNKLVFFGNSEGINYKMMHLSHKRAQNSLSEAFVEVSKGTENCTVDKYDMEGRKGGVESENFGIILTDQSNIGFMISYLALNMPGEPNDDYLGCIRRNLKPYVKEYERFEANFVYCTKFWRIIFDVPGEVRMMNLLLSLRIIVGDIVRVHKDIRKIRIYRDIAISKTKHEELEQLMSELRKNLDAYYRRMAYFQSWHLKCKEFPDPLSLPCVVKYKNGMKRLLIDINSVPDVVLRRFVNDLTDIRVEGWTDFRMRSKLESRMMNQIEEYRISAHEPFDVFRPRKDILL